METPSWASYSIAWLATLALILLSFRLLRRRTLILPPGPKPWPIIGNLNLIGPLPHRSIHALSLKYGPIMQLKFGSFPVVVASSLEMAKAVLKTNDVIFTDRPRNAAGKYTTYNYSDITWSPYGPYWRQARKIYSIPWLSFLDLQGNIKRMKALSKKFDRFLEHVLDEHNERRKGVRGYVAKDMLDVLLQLSEDPNLDVKLERHGVKAICQDLIAGATESSAVTVEWAISELLKKPEILAKATEELDRVIGRERWVEEKDIANLPYIDSIAKETMRLHPIAPLLTPRVARRNCRIAGYDVPKGTTAFGGGCVLDTPWPLGIKVIQASLGNVLHGFTWTLPDNVPNHRLDFPPLKNTHFKLWLSLGSNFTCTLSD
ncbi:hypothetical protein GQ457_09G005340 [Hibiscus cannabinus]